MKKYLITGGLGFIGNSLARALVGKGHRVRILDDSSRGRENRIADIRNNIEFVEGDIRDAKAVSSASSGVDSVLHLAYVNGTEFFYTKPDLVLDIAIRGMINVLDACKDHGVKELLTMSSSEVYQTPSRVPTDEDVSLIVPDLMNPRYSYGGGKIISELLSIHCGKTFMDRVLIVRPHNVYGPDMGLEHVIPQLITRMRNLSADNPEGIVDLPIQGSGEETRSFIYIDDFTDGLIKVLEAGKNSEVYHIGTMDEITVSDLAHKIASAFGRKIKIVPGELRPGSALRRLPDTGKIRSLGFEPKISLVDGIAKTKEWYCTNT